MVKTTLDEMMDRRLEELRIRPSVHSDGIDGGSEPPISMLGLMDSWWLECRSPISLVFVWILVTGEERRPFEREGTGKDKETRKIFLEDLCRDRESQYPQPFVFIRRKISRKRDLSVHPSQYDDPDREFQHGSCFLSVTVLSLDN